MAIYDRQFEILRPTLDGLLMATEDVADVNLLDPTSSTVVPLIDGELLQFDATGKLVRGTTANQGQPAFFNVEWRGATEVQAGRKVTVVMGGTFLADTIVWAGAPTLGGELEMATINNARFGTVDRAGLQPQSSGLVMGYAIKLPAINGGRLQFIQALV